MGTTARRLARLAIVLLGVSALVSCSSSTDPDDDLGPPAPITDLRVTGVTAASATLAWTATGDDGTSGACVRYELRRHDAFLYPATWEQGIVVPGLPQPAPAGQTETFTVTGLNDATSYFFAISAWDDQDNSFGVSNCVEAYCIDNTEVVFADAALEAAVRESLGIPTAPLRRLDLRDLHDLTVEDAGVTSMEGLEHCPNLYILHARGNQIEDLAPLAGLTELRDLGLAGNRVADISPLSAMALLEHLDLDHNALGGIAPLAGLTALVHLHLEDTGVTDLAALATLTDLVTLRAAGNAVTDLSPLAGLTTLQELWIADNAVADLGPLAGLTGLQRLSLSRNATGDLSPLAGLTALLVLDAWDLGVTDVSPLAGMTDLQALYLPHNGVADVSPLAGLVDLKVLWLTSNAVTDLAPLSGMVVLESLDLTGNGLSDLSTCAGMLGLSDLFLSINLIEDLAPLVANPGLGEGDRVSLLYNPLSFVALTEQVPALRARGVEVTLD